MLNNIGGFLGWSLLVCLFFLTHLTAEVINVDFLFLIYLAYVNITTLYMSFLILTLKSKYSTLAGMRLILLNIFCEVPFTGALFALYMMFGDYT
jgi:formate hydrogenlyase subunit 4